MAGREIPRRPFLCPPFAPLGAAEAAGRAKSWRLPNWHGGLQSWPLRVFPTAPMASQCKSGIRFPLQRDLPGVI